MTGRLNAEHMCYTCHACHACHVWCCLKGIVECFNNRCYDDLIAGHALFVRRHASVVTRQRTRLVVRTRGQQSQQKPDYNHPYSTHWHLVWTTSRYSVSQYAARLRAKHRCGCSVGCGSPPALQRETYGDLILLCRYLINVVIKFLLLRRQENQTRCNLRRLKPTKVRSWPRAPAGSRGGCGWCSVFHAHYDRGFH